MTYQVTTLFGFGWSETQNGITQCPTTYKTLKEADAALKTAVEHAKDHGYASVYVDHLRVTSYRKAEIERELHRIEMSDDLMLANGNLERYNQLKEELKTL